jgi:hypothetical protein
VSYHATCRLFTAVVKRQFPPVCHYRHVHVRAHTSPTPPAHLIPPCPRAVPPTQPRPHGDLPGTVYPHTQAPPRLVPDKPPSLTPTPACSPPPRTPRSWPTSGSDTRRTSS